MLFRPLHAMLVAASIYLGGLGAASAPMWPGDELRSALANFARSTFNPADDAYTFCSNGSFMVVFLLSWHIMSVSVALAKQIGPSKTLDPTQMLHDESFGRQMPNPHTYSHQDAGSWNTYVEGFREPLGAAQHHDSGYGSEQAYSLNTFSDPRYGQHSSFSIESAPSSHQQQETFRHPGIPSLGASQHGRVSTALHGTVFGAHHAGGSYFLASSPLGRIEATPSYLPHHLEYSRRFQNYDGVPVSHMSNMGVYAQNPAYQDTGHQTEAIPDETNDPGPVEVEAETAGKGVDGPGGDSKVKKYKLSQMANDEMRAAVLNKVLTFLENYYKNHGWVQLDQHVGKVHWIHGQEYSEEMQRKQSQDMRSRLSDEKTHWSTKPVSNNWEELVSRHGQRFDLGDFRIVFMKSLKHPGHNEVFRVVGCDKVSKKWIFIGFLEIPAQLKENQRQVRYYGPRNVHA